MKVLIVSSNNHGQISSFVKQEVNSLENLGIAIEYFLIRGKGVTGYLGNYLKLQRRIKEFKPVLIHAHYGLSGLLAVLQCRIPVITTFHGSDVNNPKIRLLSKIVFNKSAWSIFVTEKLAKLLKAKYDYSILPCGTDLGVFYPIDQSVAREKMGFTLDEKIVLFSGSFTNKVKNYPLANSAIKQLNGSVSGNKNVKLIELKGYSREEVNLLLNSCNLALLTSFSEGSPNFIREAMASNRPVVSTDVGDVRLITEGIPGCFIAQDNPVDLADKISLAFKIKHSTGARQRLIDRGLEIRETSQKIIQLYEQVLQRK